MIIRVYGRPAPQGSKDFGPAGQLLEVSPYLPAWRVAVKVAAYKAYQAAGIHHELLPLFPVAAPVTFEEITFLMAPEQPVPGMPDIDKLLRSTLDALGGAKRGTARLFADDSQVTKIRELSKFPAAGATQPGAIIRVNRGDF